MLYQKWGITSQIMAILIGDHDDSPADLKGPRPTQTGLRFSLMILYIIGTEM